MASSPDGMFGEWDAPFTDGLPKIETPVGSHCMYCLGPIVEGDNGAVHYGTVQHRECSLRAVMGGIGHMVDHAFFCEGAGKGLGPDAGLGYRASALMVWGVYVGRATAPSRAALLLLVGKLHLEWADSS